MTITFVKLINYQLQKLQITNYVSILAHIQILFQKIKKLKSIKSIKIKETFIHINHLNNKEAHHNKMQSMKMYQLVTDPNQIIVRVINPTQVKQIISNHTVYTLQGSDITGDFNVIRRYSDFDHVRTALLNKWPGCFVPPLPKKKLIGNSQFQFIQNRREGLDVFCKEISQLKHLWYSKQFQILVRETKDIEKSLKQIENPTYQSITNKYEQTLSNVSPKEYEPNLMDKIQKFQSYLKKLSVTASRSIGLIKYSKQTADYFCQSYANNNQQYGVLLNYLFPQYEKHFLSFYINSSSQQSPDKLIFANSSDQKLSQLIQQFKKIADQKKMQELFNLLEKEDRQIEAFQEVLKVRNNYQGLLKNHQVKEKELLVDQSKLNAGKQSVFKALIKKDIEDEKKNIQNQIDLNSIKIKGYTFLCNWITLILANYEIPRFYQQKVKKYYETIKIVAEFEIKISTIKEEICDHILKNKNLQEFSNELNESNEVEIKQ